MNLTEEQVNQILSYLSEKPFKEVNGLIYMIKSEWDKQHTQKENKKE